MLNLRIICYLGKKIILCNNRCTGLILWGIGIMPFSQVFSF